MPNKLTDIASLWTAAKIQGHTHLVGCYDDFIEEKDPPTVLIDYEKKVIALDNLDWSARSIALNPHRPNSSIIVGINGEFALFADGKVEERGTVHGFSNWEDSPGTILNVNCIGSTVYACGGNQQIYAMDERYTWTPFDNGLYRDESQSLSQFEFIMQSHSQGTKYVGGARGEAWSMRNKTWEKLEIPTNLRLVSSCEGTDGIIWIVGQAGLVIRGNGQAWEVVYTDDTIRFLWDVTYFKGRIFAVSDSAIYELLGDELVPVDFSDKAISAGPIPFTFYKLYRDENYLYSLGVKDWMRFDGEIWERVI